MTGTDMQQVLIDFGERWFSFALHVGFKYFTGGALW